MLQLPTNVNLHNQAVNANAIIAGTFTFHGDRLGGNACRITNYMTDEIVFENYYNRMGYNTYNNSGSLFVEVPISTLTNGEDYIFEILLTQKKENETPICDIPVLGGTIIGMGATNDELYIESDISSIYQWQYYINGQHTPTTYGSTEVTKMVIKIGNTEKKILSYNPNYESTNGTVGVLTVDSAFSQSVAGQHYEIFSNYLVSAQYFLKCRDLPTLTTSYNVYDNRIHFEAIYSQEQNVGIKYYTLTLEWSNNPDFRTGSYDDVTYGETTYITELVSKTKKVYSQQISYNFYAPYRHDENFKDGFQPDYYRVKVDLVTNDNVSCSFESEKISIGTYYNETPFYNITFDLGLKWDKERGRVLWQQNGYGAKGHLTDISQCQLFRKDLKTGEIIQLPLNGLGKVVVDGVTANSYVGCDPTAAANGKYSYTIIGVGNVNNVLKTIIPQYAIDTFQEIFEPGNFLTNEIEIEESAYYISELNLLDDETVQGNDRKATFEVGDVWKFIAEINDTTITSNLDRQVHVNYSQYISTTSTNTNYLSGTLSAMIGNINCTTKEYTDDIAVVKAWRKFITQPKPFLLKTQKGDVLVVNITDNPQTEYQENYYKIPTRFTFSWSEICSVNDINVKDTYGKENYA